VVFPLFAVRDDWRARGFELLDGISNGNFVKGSRLGSSPLLLATLSMRSTGLGMLPIGSVGMIDAGAAMLSLPLAQISSPASDWTDASRISHRLGKPHPLLRERA